jgi:hypothetical protein
MIVQRLRRPLSAVLTVVVPALSTGCFRYVPVNPAEPPEGTTVRAYLSEPARLRLEGVVPLERRYMDGRLITRDGNTFLLEMQVESSEDSALNRALMQRIPLTREEVVSLQIRELDRTRSALGALVFAAGATALLVRMLSGKAGGGNFPPEGGGQTEAVVPIMQH